MFHQCIILIVGLVTLMHVSATNASGLCSCSCCDGDQCDVIQYTKALQSLQHVLKRQVQQSCRLQQRARRLMGSVHVRVVMVISVIRYMKALQLPHRVLNLIV
ncbi:unnamed protein product [Rotaria socialis]|uniref:Secreted protein n=1 Tax=Rotaria socialis TaxID=392032 RepID=A0A818INF8_9BILA|nr:unnamed protein product [Rotaria socialis]CAF4769885.1 unnamed protein product [Rotaria socialis]